MLLLALLLACAVDADGDGWPRSEDCDDHDAEIHPDAREQCDGVDNDCDGTVDEPDATDALAWWPDADGDGFGAGGVAKACAQPNGWAGNDLDCDDTDDDVNPDADETEGNGVDDDCDPSTPD